MAGALAGAAAIELNADCLDDREPSGHGYWRWAATRVFAFGDANFYGSTAAAPERPIVAIAPTPDGHATGRWAHGGVFAFGDAAFYGSTAAST